MSDFDQEIFERHAENHRQMYGQPKIRIILKTERRVHAGSPIITDHEIVEVEAPEVVQRVRRGGYNEDGTFEVTQVVGVEVPRS